MDLVWSTDEQQLFLYVEPPVTLNLQGGWKWHLGLPLIPYSFLTVETGQREPADTCPNTVRAHSEHFQASGGWTPTFLPALLLCRFISALASLPFISLASTKALANLTP